MDSNSLYDRLEKYGADMKGINSRFFDEKDFYMECFCDFLTEPNFKGLDDALKSKDYESAFASAHSLKGISANLGLVPFYKTVCTLVESLRAEDYRSIAYEYQKVREEKLRLDEILK